MRRDNSLGYRQSVAISFVTIIRVMSAANSQTNAGCCPSIILRLPVCWFAEGQELSTGFILDCGQQANNVYFNMCQRDRDLLPSIYSRKQIPESKQNAATILQVHDFIFFNAVYECFFYHVLFLKGLPKGWPSDL